MNQLKADITQKTYSRTLNIIEASKFLGAHKETVRRMVANGIIPAAKIGRSWRFIEDDLVMYIRNKYSTWDASQGVNIRSIDTWHSTKEMGSGGQIFTTKESVYEKVLGLR
ncbi:DNA-binding protein [Legionella longbeachae]|uniref:helix-turn-helix domain-containing protein n=1 Tax=Legionella longbeachae TaxID=450 RepID=UPI0009B73C59|nr:helix-turn-helix domain-containing protein [Legionella longbeachae]ARB94013.1 DNA-binding protein [Legionella longbeachae]ARM32525.1 helix-turn-helix domain-containing protein [Legionella longbeachae]RZV25026.1 DNA-binding protein [Legionella longbeachae]UAK45752.1 helix-turn-helix domain-containing protein [Legionella longbeachae]